MALVCFQGMPFKDLLGQNLKLALRALWREPAFSLTAVLTFALCLAANVVIFSVVDAVLLKPLPFPDADRLVTVHNSYPRANVDRAPSSVPHYLERKAGIASFEEAGAIQETGATIGEAGATERVEATRATPSFLRTLRSEPMLGRGFLDEEGFYGKHQVVLLSHALWRDKFGADPKVLGRSLRIDGNPHEIIGVMPPEFRFLESRALLWTPLCFNDEQRGADNRHSNFITMVARLKEGCSIALAQAQVDALNREKSAEDPYAKMVEAAGFTTYVKDLKADAVREIKPVLLLLQAAVFFLLLIGVVNLTNLFLVRSSARSKSLSIRRVLGAGRLHIILQLTAETLTVSLVGALMGLGLGWLGLNGLRLWAAAEFPFLQYTDLNTAVVLWSLVTTALVGLLLAMPMIWHTFQSNPASALSVESRGGTTTRAAHRLRHGLIIAQFALAFVLLVGSGLLGLSFRKVLEVQPGFSADHVLTGAIHLPWSKYKEPPSRLALLERIQGELEQIPGVKSASATGLLPFSNDYSNNATWVEGHDPKPGESLKAHFVGGVMGGYFQTLGMRLIEGRFLTQDDCHTETRFCVVDQDFARYYWPNESALGHRLFTQPPDTKPQPYTIVGVVASIKLTDLSDDKAPGVLFLPYNQAPSLSPRLLVRTNQDPESIGNALRQAVAKADPDMPVSELKSMELRLEESLNSRRMPLILAAIFAAVALLLAAVGIYGVLAYTVEQRRREIGVRMALGALPAQIRTQFLGLAVRLVLLGVGLGLVGSWFAGQGMRSLLYGVSPMHPLVLACTALALTLLAIAACLIPSLRAARVAPMVALRGE